MGQVASLFRDGEVVISDGYNVASCSDEDDSEDVDQGEDIYDANESIVSSWSQNLAQVFREKHVYFAAAIFNSTFIYSRRSSSTRPSQLWHITSLANLGLWYYLSRQPLERPSKNSKPRVAKFKKTKTKTDDPLSATTIFCTTKKTTKIHFKPRAGSSTVKVETPRDSSIKDGYMFAKWRPRPGQVLEVRSYNYKKTKQKVPSPGCMYECVAVDSFKSDHRYPDMAKRVVLPKVEFADNKDQPKTWHAPDIFVVSLQVPTEAPTSMFKPSTDGVGHTLTMYFVMRQDTRDVLRRVTANNYDDRNELVGGGGDVQKSKVNAVRLFEKWCRQAPDDPEMQARFKFVPNIQNIKEAGLPGYMAGYNGKPVLIKRSGKTGFLYQHPELSAMEFDVSLHPFPYLAKQGIHYFCQTLVSNLVIIFGFVIESRENDELPECLIGLSEVCYLDPRRAQKGTDLFGGNSHKSE